MEPYVRWCGRSVDKIIIYLLPDHERIMQQIILILHYFCLILLTVAIITGSHLSGAFVRNPCNYRLFFIFILKNLELPLKVIMIRGNSELFP